MAYIRILRVMAHMAPAWLLRDDGDYTVHGRLIYQDLQRVFDPGHNCIVIDQLNFTMINHGF